MFTKFWDKFAEGVVGQWTAQKWGPVLVFWVVGVLSWGCANGWPGIEAWFKNIDKTVLILAGLLLAGVSTTASRWCERPVIRICEGYWFGWLGIFHACFVKGIQKDRAALQDQWDALETRVRSGAALTLDEEAEKIRLDLALREYPVSDALLMPTTLGNRLRAAEEYPYERYGLEPLTCWPRFWLVLPDDTRKTLAAARSDLNDGAGLLFWSLLTACWAILCPWAILALVVVPIAYQHMTAAALTYGDMIRAAFDLHRFRLYEALKFPLPTSVHAEKPAGAQLTEFLMRGTVSSDVTFERGGKSS